MADSHPVFCADCITEIDFLSKLLYNYSQHNYWRMEQKEDEA